MLNRAKKENLTAQHLVQANLGTQIQEIEKVLTREWQWPSPEAGFSFYIWSLCGLRPRFLSLGDATVSPDSFEDIDRWDYSPTLAGAGYAASVGLLPPHLFNRWQQGFERLRGRSAFPSDRQSFAFRPQELLGITLGANSVTGTSDNARLWLSQVLKGVEFKSAPFDFWSRSISTLAAAQVDVTWSAVDRDLFDDAKVRIGRFYIGCEP